MSGLINDDDRQSLVALGCLGLLIIVIRFWWLAIIAAGFALVIWVLLFQLRRANYRLQERYIQNAQERHIHAVISVKGVFYQIQDIQLSREANQLRLEIVATCVKGEGDHVHAEDKQITLWQGHSGIPQQSVSLLLTRQTIQIISPVAVEATALATAMDCLAELRWCHNARIQLDTMQQAAVSTLEKSTDNPLLEHAVPSLKKALNTFKSEEQKIRINQDETRKILSHLADFLSVPESLRPILSLDLSDWNPEQRLKDLEQSFQDVILLNDTFIELNRSVF